jgi:hypothetical protein
MRLGVLVTLAGIVLVLAAPSWGGGVEVHLNVSASAAPVGKPVQVVLRAYTLGARGRVLADAPGRRLRVEAVSPARHVTHVPIRHTARGTWKGSFRFPTVGRWHVRVGNWPKGGHGPQVVVDVRRSGPTPAPTGFGPLGRAGCAPPSPRNRTGDTLARAEVFGTTLGGRFWGLFAFMPVADAWASDDTAVLEHVRGKEIKIVFKLDHLPTAFYAVAPNGTRTPPVWGPDEHESSSWSRPGAEWGAGFVFGENGCWRIHAGGGKAAGDIWLRVLS